MAEALLQSCGSSTFKKEDSSMKWNDDKTITITPPAKPKKITGTRFAAIMANAITSSGSQNQDD